MNGWPFRARAKHDGGGHRYDGDGDRYMLELSTMEVVTTWTADRYVLELSTMEVITVTMEMVTVTC